jgi:type IV pilus assembly protein PilC
MIDLSPLSNKRTHAAVVKESPLAFLNKDIRLFGSGFSDRKKERFYSELHTLLVAGVDIRTAFELMEEEAVRQDDKKLYAAILQAIIGGSTLPEAIRTTQRFSDYEFYSLRIGEESGRMNHVLHDLSGFYARKIKQKRKVTSALSYPLIVISVAIVAVVFMLRFVVPMFADMLGRFGSELPALTKTVITVSDFLGAYGLWMVAVILLVSALLYSQRKTLWYRRTFSALLLRTPFIGRVTQKVYVERFAHAMHLLLVSKTNLIDALELVQKMVAFYPIEKSLQQIRTEVFAGKSLHESMAKHDIYPKRMISLIRVAEEVNQVDVMFAKLSQQLSDEIEHETSLLGSVIEPFMILILGVLVAVILVAMYLPMFRLGTAFN